MSWVFFVHEYVFGRELWAVLQCCTAARVYCVVSVGYYMVTRVFWVVFACCYVLFFMVLGTILACYYMVARVSWGLLSLY